MASRRLLALFAILTVFNLSHFALAQDPVQPEAPANSQRCFFSPGGDNVVEPPPENDAPVPRPTSCPDGSKPRDPPQQPAGKLRKRTLIIPDNFDNQPPGRINNFITQQITEGRNQQNLVPHAGRDGQFNAMGGISSSKFIDLKNTRLNTGVEGLHGCTTVVIVAKHAIWVSHHWEIPGFLNVQLAPNGAPILGSETPVSDAEFQSRVLDFFRLGDSTGGQTNLVFPGFASKTAPGEVFGSKDELLKVVIVTPRDAEGVDAPPGIYRFPQLVQKIKDELKSIFKDVDPDLDPVIADYNVLNLNDPAKEARHGTVLVQYDPRQQPPGDPVRKAIVRIWVQGEQVGGSTGDLTWDPLPDQRKRDLFSRQVATADDPCPEVNVEQPTTLVTEPAPAPTDKPATLNYSIKLHQWMEGENSFLEWSQIDSNGKTIAGPSKEGVIPGNADPFRTEVLIHVSEPTNKDKVLVDFTLNTNQPNDGCQPTWNIGTLESGQNNPIKDCFPNIGQPRYGCDPPTADMWKPINAGFERDFECFYLDINLKSTVITPLIGKT
jgi:hypothetical protein